MKNVEMVGWTAEDLAERGCWGSVVTVAFFAWPFLFVRPVVALCGRERGVGGVKNKGGCVQSCAPTPPTPISHAL